VYYRPGTWKREVIADSIEGVLHGICVTDWDGDTRDEVLTASFLGIHLFRSAGTGGWGRTELTKGNPEPWPKSGSSDLAVGRLGKTRFLCSIEPWHGNQVVVYTPEGEGWRRNVIDSSLANGHAICAADLNSDGRDEIIAGFRDKPRDLYVFSADDLLGRHWSRQTLDAGGMGAAACAVADLNADGRPDIACIGAATLKWYENLGN
jgi:hypothetical protein